MHDPFGCRDREFLRPCWMCSPHEPPDMSTKWTCRADMSKKVQKIDAFLEYVEDVDISEPRSIRLDFERLHGDMLVIRCPRLLYGVFGQGQMVMGLGVGFDKALGISAPGG